jgi:SAM-dependent methyltransferase
MPRPGRRADDDRIVAILNRLCVREALQRYDRTGGWFPRYRGGLADPVEARRFVTSLRSLLRHVEGGAEGKDALDLGCGFGMACLVVALLGAREVHGIDLFRPMVESFEAWLPDVPEGTRIHPRTGLARELPYADASLDLAITVEALSHFLDPLRCLAEAHRVLRPDGFLVIADDNNAASPSTVRRVREVWDRFENGPAGAQVHGDRVKVPYREKRRALLARQFPSLAAADLEDLSSGTCYALEDEVIRAGDRFLATGERPASRFDPARCPIDPETGQFMENLLDPFALRQELERLGFQVRLEAYFGGESRGGAVLLANGLLNRLLPERLALRLAGGFRIWARKRANP